MNWTARPDLTWCPGCGANADIETAQSPIGERWVCLSCGLQGRFSSGLPDPSIDQPPPSAPERELYDADPNCNHKIQAQWSGVKCTKCTGWFCY